jgi:hypothetical protein
VRIGSSAAHGAPLTSSIAAHPMAAIRHRAITLIMVVPSNYPYRVRLCPYQLFMATPWGWMKHPLS